MAIFKLDESIVSVDPLDKLVPQTGTGKTDASLDTTSVNAVENKAVAVKIEQLESDIAGYSVSVTTDGVKTYSQLLDALYALVTASQYDVTINSCVVINGIKYSKKDAGAYFVCQSDSTASVVETIYFRSTNSLIYSARTTATGTAFSEYTNSVPPTGRKIAFVF